MTTQKSRKLYELILHVRPLFKHLAHKVEVELEGTGVTIPMRAIMEQLSFHGSLTVPEVARRLLLKRQSVQPVLDKLHEMELVERQVNPAHKKSWVFRLTPQGEAVLASIKGREHSVLDEISEEYSEEDINTAINVLAKLDQDFAQFYSWRDES